MTKHTRLLISSFLLLIGCTATPAKLGVDNGQLTPCPPTPNCVSSQATNEAHLVAPINFVGTSQQAQTQILQAVNEFEQSKIVTVQDNYIRAEFTSKIFSFVDDVEFYFPPSDNAEITIQLRSASRIGYADMGANLKRIEQLRTKFNAPKT